MSFQGYELWHMQKKLAQKVSKSQKISFWKGEEIKKLKHTLNLIQLR